MEVMPNAPSPRRRPGQRAETNLDEAEKLHALQLRFADSQNSLEVVGYLARMMTRHAAATVRVYGESILRAIEDPDAWLAMAPVQTLEDMEIRANPVLSAIADQVEAELSELASAFPSDPYRASAILD